jgi:glycosyltransferase involved in cell wall biosynthesis
MARAAVAFKPDVCWANDADTLRAAASAARTTGARLIYDSHEVIWDVPQLKRRWKWRWAFVERTQIRRADAVSTVCDPIADLMAARYRIARPAVIMNCPAIAESQTAPTPADSALNAYRGPGERIVLYPGNLAPYRGIEQIVDALPHLPDNVRFVILGHGAYRPVLEAYVRDKNLAERVTFITSVPVEELLGMVAGADLGVVSHLRRGRNQEYVMPNKLFEFMHIGVPVVSNDLPLVAPIVREVGFGTVVDLTNSRALAGAISALLDDPATRAQMRERALAGARRYCWEHEQETVLALVEGRAPEPVDHQKL